MESRSFNEDLPRMGHSIRTLGMGQRPEDIGTGIESSGDPFRRCRTRAHRKR
jgi:hypothetical protein